MVVYMDPLGYKSLGIGVQEALLRLKLEFSRGLRIRRIRFRTLKAGLEFRV